MFLGHFAMSLAAKKPAPQVSLGTLFIAAQLIDLLWPLFLLLGIEHASIDIGNTTVTPLNFYDYPFTHSLAGVLLWSCAFGLIHYAARRDTRNALILGGVVLSHWILDLMTHRPDLPLWFSGGPYVGLGLWNSLPGTVIVEAGLFILGVYLYITSTTPKDRIGSIGFWSLAAFLAVTYFANLAGPPPPDVATIAVAGNATWILVAWAYWIDRHRQTRSAGLQKS